MVPLGIRRVRYGSKFWSLFIISKVCTPDAFVGLQYSRDRSVVKVFQLAFNLFLCIIIAVFILSHMHHSYLLRIKTLQLTVDFNDFLLTWNCLEFIFRRGEVFNDVMIRQFFRMTAFCPSKVGLTGYIILQKVNKYESISNFSYHLNFK